jgi:hypothetical protein
MTVVLVARAVLEVSGADELVCWADESERLQLPATSAMANVRSSTSRCSRETI